MLSLIAMLLTPSAGAIFVGFNHKAGLSGVSGPADNQMIKSSKFVIE